MYRQPNSRVVHFFQMAFFDARIMILLLETSVAKHVPKGPPVRTRGLLGQWLSLCYSCNVLQANRSTSISMRKLMFEKHWCTKWVPRVYQMGTTGVPNGYHGCTKWAPQVYQMGTTGAPHGYVRWHQPVWYGSFVAVVCSR